MFEHQSKDQVLLRLGWLFHILVFYSPRDIESMYSNFPEFQQNDIKIAVFGESTYKKAIKHYEIVIFHYY